MEGEFEIRPPWPDELPRVRSFLREYSFDEETFVQIALVGRWKRIVGVAVRGKDCFVRVRPIYSGSDLEEGLLKAVSGGLPESDKNHKCD